MRRISGAVIANYICSLIWVVIGIDGICNGSPYASSYYKFFAALWFAAIATYYLLVGIGKIKPFSKKKKAIIGVTGLVVVLAVFFICVGNYTVETYKYNIKSEKIPESFDGFRIVQVSDLHNAEFDKYNSTVLSPIFHAEPDIIVITGDLIDSRNTKVDVAISIAQKAVNIAPVYYINGNHEARVPDEYEKLKQGLIDAGVTILENDSVDITIGDEAITLIGLNDSSFTMEEYVDDTMMQNVSHQLMSVVLDNNNYKVLLAHKPDYFDVYAGKVDLVLSGHAHGGQFRIPFVGGLVAPGQGFFPEYYEGSHIKENTEMIVSRGIGNSIIPFRINNKPEIVVAELTKIAK